MSDELSDMFGDFDANKIEMEMAFEAMASMFKGLKKAGLNGWEAAQIVAASVKASEPTDTKDDNG